MYECIVGHHETDAEKAAEIAGESCCMPCAVANNHPGKFQQYSSSDEEAFLEHCAEGMGKALILYEWAMNGSEDESMGPEGWGRTTRFDNYLLNESEHGFVDFDEYKTVEEAQKEYEKLYKDGWGQDENDIYLSFERGEWRAFDGESQKVIPVWPRSHGEDRIDRNRMRAAISLYMRKNGYYPNVWEVNERGSVTSIGEEIW